MRKFAPFLVRHLCVIGWISHRKYSHCTECSLRYRHVRDYWLINLMLLGIFGLRSSSNKALDLILDVSRLSIDEKLMDPAVGFDLLSFQADFVP